MMKALVFLAVAAVFVSADEEVVERAIVRLDGNGVTGNVTFTRQPDGKIRITGTVVGMPPGSYGFHIHEKGDITNGCGSTLAHFNPNGNDHGHPHDENRHVGDLGNVQFDQSNTAHIDFEDHQIKLNGRHNIIGRGLVLHSAEDDYGKGNHPDSKKTGNAGSRVACGVIGILESSPSSATSAAGTWTGSIFLSMIVYSIIAALLRN